MFQFLVTIFWFILGLFGIKKTAKPEQAKRATPVLHNNPAKVSDTPTTCLIRDIARQAPDEMEKINELKKMVGELRSEIAEYKISNQKLMEENKKLRETKGQFSNSL